MNFADRLKSLRTSSDMTQEDLAKATGLKRSAIGMYESGKRKPDYETLEIIADYFNVDMNFLLGKSNTSNSVNPYSLTKDEVIHVKKYRQLDENRKHVIDEQIDYLLYKQAQEAESKEEHLA